MIRAVLFDLDDTLMDRTRTVIGFMQDQYRRYQLDHLPYDLYLERFLALDERGYGDKPRMFQTLVQEFNIPHPAEELLNDFRKEAWSRCHNFPDAVQVLTELKARGYKLGVITNGSTEQRTKLANTGLNALLDVSLVSEEEQMPKPNPGIFLRAAQRLGVDAAVCIFVGDNPSTDILGARRSGMKSVWLKGNFAWPHHLTFAPDYTITSLSEILAFPI
jgi:putative hydrolase of the HAD superfamily